MTDRSSSGTNQGRRTPWQVIASRLVSDRNVRCERNRGYGPDPRHRFDRYVPKAEADPSLPPLIFVYGGGWRAGERGCYGFVGSALAANGFETIVPDYRLYPEARFPEFVEDIALCYAQIAFSRRATRPAPVLIGHSAGAHICALIACDPRYRLAVDRGTSRPTAFVGLSGPYGFDPTTSETTHEIFAPARATPDLTRPVAQTRRSVPPALLFHGGRDRIVTPDATRLFHDALCAVGAQAQMRIIPWVGHSATVLGFARPVRWFLPVLSETVAFVRATASVSSAEHIDARAI